ncbi:unnamed protein product [Brassica rapa]|uniref:Secreted protein n=1 Tax=Brassica campestris TaxID=3711 RepID=A0A3P6CN09_BRACM|nr:unnamed protein product [Brassica rapa]VDD11451.1 unnamed protein product [Brassica rapa]
MARQLCSLMMAYVFYGLHIVCNTIDQRMNVIPYPSGFVLGDCKFSKICAPSFIWYLSKYLERQAICCSCICWEYARVWILFMKDIHALHIEDGFSRGSRTALTPSYNNTSRGQALWLVHCYKKLNNGGTYHAVFL